MPYLTQLKSKKWRAVYRDRTGRRRSITRPTKAEARAEALERESEVRRGTWRDPDLGKVTVETWLARWQQGRVVEPNTARKNKSHLDNHILPQWKTTLLDGIDKLAVQTWVAKMQREKVGAATIREAHALFSTILGAAVEHHLIPANPARGVSLPTVPRQPFRILSGDEVDAVLEHLDGQDKRIVQLSHLLGLRWGEVTGLHTHRVDPGRRELHVVEVATRHDGIKDYPKTNADGSTPSSRRTLPLTDGQVGMLREQMAGKAARSLLFTTDNDKLLDYTNWRRRVWLPAVKEAKLDDPQPTFHDLRHTCASNLVEDGVDLAKVQAFMGHESLTTTARYVHTTKRYRDDIRAVMQAREGHSEQREPSENRPGTS